jgi:diguanylate cyclase (GGDEF)-like protein
MSLVTFSRLFSSSVEYWFIAPVLYSSLAFSIMLVVSNVMSQTVEMFKRKSDESNNRLEEIVKASPFPIILSRLVDDKILLANHNAVKLFALENEKPNKKLTDFFADSSNKRQLVEILERKKEVQDFEVLITTEFNETPFWLLTSSRVIDFDNNVVLYSAFQDITSRKNREILLKNQATRDPLTRVYNRRYFDEEVTKKIVKAKEKGESYSILMVDADHFKKVNDNFGHKTGDKVLMELAETCERALRDSDVVARYGGEEFVIFLSNVGSAKGKIVADRLRDTISRLKVYSDSREIVTFTVSIGISGSEISDDIDVLIKAADDALYQAKENGRNRVEVFLTDNIHKVKDIQETKNISEIDKRPSIEMQSNLIESEVSLLDNM